MGTTNDYIIVIKLTNVSTGEVQIQKVENEAYNLNEALMQAFYELDAKLGCLDQELWKIKVQSVGPRSSRSNDVTEYLEKFLKEIRKTSKSSSKEP